MKDQSRHRLLAIINGLVSFLTLTVLERIQILKLELRDITDSPHSVASSISTDVTCCKRLSISVVAVKNKLRRLSSVGTLLMLLVYRTLYYCRRLDSTYSR